MNKTLRFEILLVFLLALLILVSCGSDDKVENNNDLPSEQVLIQKAQMPDLSTEMVSTDSVGPLLILLLLLAALFLISGILFVFMPFDLWIRAVTSKVWIWPLALVRMRIQKIDLPLVVHHLVMGRQAGLKITLADLESLYLSGVDVKEIVESLIQAYNGHLPVSLADLKSHYLSGGRVHSVIHAMVAAHSADIKLPPEKQLHLSFKDAASIDHAGVNVAEAVENYIRPKVVETDEIVAVAKDGVEITAKARITIRTNMKKIVMGADAQTVKAQVNEKIVSIIGMALTHQEILENAYEIGEKVMRERDTLFENTAFEVLSIDLAAIQVGRDVRATLEAEKANAKLASEKAREQEMKNLMTEARIQHLHAESEVQKAMADAFRDGNISVREYFNLMNTEADTIMRKSYANPPTTDPKKLKTDEQ